MCVYLNSKFSFNTQQSRTHAKHDKQGIKMSENNAKISFATKTNKQRQNYSVHYVSSTHWELLTAMFGLMKK
jgi:hypothetical protein